MPLPRRNSTPDNWIDEIADAAETEMRATISFWEPQPSVPYDAETDTGGPVDPIELFSTKARVQHLGTPGEATAGGEWITERRFRFQFPLREWTDLIPKGTIVQVDDGHRDSALEGVTYTVLSAIGSSNAAVRTVECVSELGATEDE